MFDAAARGGLPVLFPRRIDFPAASALCGFHGRFTSTRLGAGSKLAEKTSRAIANARDLFSESGHVHPPIGLGLYGAD
jgi:hypothetical protein